MKNCVFTFGLLAAAVQLAAATENEPSSVTSAPATQKSKAVTQAATQATTSQSPPSTQNGTQAATQRGAVPVRPNGPWARLHGDTRDDVVRLAWQLHEWPAGTVSFNLMRRAVDAKEKPTGEWEKVNSRPLIPAIATPESLPSVESDAGEVARLRAVLTTENNGIEFKNIEGFYKRGMTDGKYPEFYGLGRLMFLTEDRPILLGLGYSDHNFSGKLDRFEYGLFRVDAQGKQGEKPISTYITHIFRADDPDVQASNLQIKRTQGAAHLTWQLSESSVQKWSIFGFHVYRAEKGSKEFQRVTQAPVGGPNSVDGVRQWHYSDNTAVAGKAYTYAVVPRNIFGRELPGRVEKPLELEDVAPLKVAVATLKQVVQLDRNRVQVSWDFDNVNESQITGFVVERADLPSRKLVAIGKPLSAKTREFVDTEAKVDKQAYAYRITAMGNLGPLSNSLETILLYADAPIPVKPTGLKAEIINEKGITRVRLKWNATTDKATEGFQLYMDNATPGDVQRQASVPAIKGNEFTFDQVNDEGREYTVGIAGVGDRGQEGARAEYKLAIPGKLMPRVNELKTTRDGKSITVTWEYPDNSFLAGFRVLDENNKVLADEKALRGTERRWVFTGANPNTAYTFNIVAVSKNGIVSTTKSVLANLPPQAIFESTKPPTGLKASWGENGIDLAWDVSKEAGTQYQLAFDEKILGVSGPLKEIASENGHYTLKVENKERSYRLRMVAVAPGKGKSLSTEVLCLAPGRVLPPVMFKESPSMFDAKKGVNVFKFTWQYDTPPELEGFHVLVDGKVKETLGKDIREWSVEGRSSTKFHSVEVEAFGAGSVVSERGPALRYSE